MIKSVVVGGTVFAATILLGVWLSSRDEPSDEFETIFVTALCLALFVSFAVNPAQ